ncbi:MAG TPA: hypothetical protein VGM29_15120 [Polyangiaceae bacterium]|jgi:hypothetical protein
MRLALGAVWLLVLVSSCGGRARFDGSAPTSGGTSSVSPGTGGAGATVAVPGMAGTGAASSAFGGANGFSDGGSVATGLAGTAGTAGTIAASGAAGAAIGTGGAHACPADGSDAHSYLGIVGRQCSAPGAMCDAGCWLTCQCGNDSLWACSSTACDTAPTLICPDNLPESQLRIIDGLPCGDPGARCGFCQCIGGPWSCQ